MKDSLGNKVVRAIESVTGTRPQGEALHEPVLDGNEKAYLAECIDTGWVSSVGQFVDRFEADLESYTGVLRAVAVVNGTAALHLALLLAGVNREDEVLLPSLTFVATANAVAYCGAVPHFCEIEARTLGLDVESLGRYLDRIADSGQNGTINTATGRRIAAIVPMHTFGHPVDLDPLMDLCARYKLTLVEDAAESLGSLYKGRHTGTFGRVAALSFNGNKIVTCGGGGAVLTDDSDLGAQAKHLSTTARVKNTMEFRHDRVGFNYRMPNINAALGCAQLERIDTFLTRKRRLADSYRQAFRDINEVRFFSETDCVRSNYWLNAIILDDDSKQKRDSILALCHEHKFMARPAWTPMHQLEIYEGCPRMDLSFTDNIAARIINLPSGAGLTS